jgi:plasmid maintenance system antidote protein VapI
MTKFKRTMIMAVREMMERNWDIATMAARLHMDPVTVQAIVVLINNIAT